MPRVCEALFARCAPGTRPTALDVASGSGRHTLLLARLGFSVFSVDRDQSRVQQTARSLRDQGLAAALWVADLEVSQWSAHRTFDLVLCTRFLERALWPVLRRSVTPGGFVIYETFTTSQRCLASGPRSPRHLLTSGELHRVFADWEVWEYQERRAPEAVAQLLARHALRS